MTRNAAVCGYFAGVTVIEIIQRSAEFLARKGVDSPRLQVELLLAHTLKIPRMKLYLDFERQLTEAELNEVRELVRRRGLREPLQHILGSVCFCGFELAVNGNVLIPRPETELLAEAGWKFLNEVGARSETSTALDIGTGSGCIAIALAMKSPTTRIMAVDISPAALEVARENAARHQTAERITFLEGDAFGAVAKDARFDLVISNPPYIPSGEIAGLQREVRDFDPRLALDGGTDGLDFYRRFADGAAGHLNPTGRLMLEIGDGQAKDIGELFSRRKWIVEPPVLDYNRQARIIIARPPDGGAS